MSNREIKPIMWHSEPKMQLPGPQVPQAQFEQWLVNEATQYKLDYGLAHADDGVIWGQFSQGQWSWSSSHSSAISPSLQGKTLQQLRLFGSNAEVLVWREENQWRGRVITDRVEAGSQCCFDEAHLLWGKPHGVAEHGFQLMREGSQGLVHAPPVAIAQTGKLMTRNYIEFDDDGCAFVRASRLTTNRTTQD